MGAHIAVVAEFTSGREQDLAMGAETGLKIIVDVNSELTQ